MFSTKFNFVWSFVGPANICADVTQHSDFGGRGYKDEGLSQYNLTRYHKTGHHFLPEHLFIYIYLFIYFEVRTIQ